MTINLSGGLTALSMLSGTNSYTGFASTPDFETRAVRAAKAQFTLATTTPPWKQAAAKTPESAQISAIKQMASIIDTSVSIPNAGSVDVQTAFTTYKALDKLKLLATAAARTTTLSAERTALQATFAKGLADLQAYLGQAPANDVELSFGLPTRRAGTIAVSPSDPTKMTGTGILEARDAPLPGLTGTEVLKVSLNKPGASDTLTIDLAQTVQPPTLDSVSDAINAAITAIPLRNPDGSVVLDDNGNPKPRWLVHFLPDKSSGKWGFGVKAPNSAEQASIDQVGARDALVVASGQTALGATSVTQILRFDDAAGSLTRAVKGTIAGLDSAATARAKLTAVAPAKGVTPSPISVNASTIAQAIATDAQGFSYVVGTTSGDMASNRSSGTPDLFLTKIDSEGGVMWQRSLGATGGAQGAAVSVSANGDITVAGTVSGSFEGATTDGDMLVSRYNAQGDESFTTVVRALGADAARAIAVGADGSIYLGGKSAGGDGDAFISRLDATGKLQERRTIDGGGSDAITALAIGQDGNLLALTNENGDARLRRIDAASLASDLGSVTLGHADARALAVSDDGTIAVAGATSAALSGAQANARRSGQDGFVSRIDAGLGSITTSYLATAGNDQVDSVAFMNGALYVAGRTTGDMNGTRRGVLDGFVSRIDAATGTVETTTQFGQSAERIEPVRLAAAPGGDSVLGALGLHRGTLNPSASTLLVAQTSLRPGDEFSLRIQGGAAKKVVIQADDTLATLGDRIRRLTGSKAKVATANVGGSLVLNIDATAGSSVALVAGAPGKDALAKLGLDPARLAVPLVTAHGAPKVHPGGNFGLALTEALNVLSAKDAAATLKVLNGAISTTQTAYRSLYWDAGKAALTNGSSGSTALTAAQSAQLDSYKSALARLTPTTDATSINFYTGL
jgi:trimeric autotransporter adhesin